ncbi:MAG TPA: LamG-like jellyroll fold domain-containing protein [Verrucomicrobiae bacterium]
MKTSPIIALFATVSILAAPRVFAGTSIAINFQGRDGTATGNPGTPGPSPADTVGAVPQQFWNNVDDSNGNLFTPTENGVVTPLVASDNSFSDAALVFACNDSWYNDVNPTVLTTGTAKLMNGIIKVNTSATASFAFTNVPEGQYDLYLYTTMNGDGVQEKFWDMDYLTTYYVTAMHQFYDTNTLIEGTNTDPNGQAVTNICNYVKFSNLGTYGRGKIGVSGHWIKNGDGIGVAGLQLVNIGPAIAQTNPVSIVTQPASRRVVAGETNLTFSVVARGPLVTYQWYKNGSPISGATDATYLHPAVAAADNGATIHVVAANNINSAQSSNAVITIGQLVAVPGIKEQLWYGATRATVESGSYDAVSPDRLLALALFESPNEQGDNFGERLSAMFKPQVTGDYVFFITADDDSDLFVSTDATPANKRMVAQETSWSDPRTWTSDNGDATVTPQKRSDKWKPDAATPPPFASGIHLLADTIYYIEAVHHEGGGGDEVDVTYKLIGEPDPVDGDHSRINAFQVAPYPLGLDGAYIVVTDPPTNTTGIQSLTATFNIAATAGFRGDASGLAPGIAYQWQSAPSGSTTFTNIPGANATSYTTPILKLTDNGKQFRVALLANDASTNSSVAILTVAPDVTPPRAVGVSTVSAYRTNVVLTFNEMMDKTSAETAANYVFTPGNIAGATASLDASLTTVTLTTATPLTEGTNVVTITGVKDLAGNPVAANTTITFKFTLVTYQASIQFDGPVGFFRFEDAVGSGVAINNGTSGINGAYYTGDEPATGAGGTPSTAKGDPGPRPPQFAGFDAANHSATFSGPSSAGGTQEWVDTKNQYLNHLAAFSLEYWVAPSNRVSNPTAFGTRIGIVGQNDAIEYGFIDQNTIQIWTPNGGSLNTAYSFPDGQWHHIATICSGSNIKNYFDGVLVGTGGNATTDYGDSVYNVHIGGGGVFDAGGNYFTGNIDEVAIFEKAIPAARILEHFNAGKEGGVITETLGVTPTPNNLVLTVTRSGNNINISWTPTGGKLQSTPALGASPVWTDVGTANPAVVPVTTSHSFFRVQQ